MARRGLSRAASFAGLVGTVLAAAAAASTVWLFVRLAMRGGLSATAYATVGVFGREVHLGTTTALGFYAILFIAYPAFLLTSLLWTLFASDPRKLDDRVRSKTPAYAAVALVVGLSDAVSLAATGLHGEAGVFATAADAAMFAVFLVHRFAMAAFFAVAYRRGFARLPLPAWLLPVGWSLAVAGVAAWRCAASDWTLADVPAIFHALAGANLAVAFTLAAAASTKGGTGNAPSE